MPTPSQPPTGPARRPWQPRFSILSIMLTTLVVSVAAAAVSYLVNYQSESDGHFGQLMFLLITLAGPLVLVVLVSLVRRISEFLSRPRRRGR